MFTHTYTHDSPSLLPCSPSPFPLPPKTESIEDLQE